MDLDKDDPGRALSILQTFVERNAAAPASMTVTLHPQRYVVIGLAAAVTGYTAKAISNKVQEGVWREGREWVRGPDGRILIDLEGYRKWVEGGK